MPVPPDRARSIANRRGTTGSPTAAIRWEISSKCKSSISCDGAYLSAAIARISFRTRPLLDNWCDDCFRDHYIYDRYGLGSGAQRMIASHPRCHRTTVSVTISYLLWDWEGQISLRTDRKVREV